MYRAVKVSQSGRLISYWLSWHVLVSIFYFSQAFTDMDITRILLNSLLALAGLVADHTLVIVDGAGHISMSMRSQTRMALLKFLRRHTGKHGLTH